MGSIRPSLILCVGALIALAFASGCFAVADLDRYHGPSDASADQAADGGADSSSSD